MSLQRWRSDKRLLLGSAVRAAAQHSAMKYDRCKL